MTSLHVFDMDGTLLNPADKVRIVEAVNADHHLAELSALSYCGNDLAGAYALGRVLLAAPS